MENNKFNADEIGAAETNAVDDARADDAPAPIARRKFINQVGGLITGVTLAALSLKSVRAQDNIFSRTRKLPIDVPAGQDFNARDGNRSLFGRARANRAYEIRVEAAQRQRNVPIPAHPDNGDEDRYQNQNYFANFSKGLRHDEFGEVDPLAYRALLNAVGSGRFSDFENLREFQGCADATRQRPFVNPLAGYAYDLEGTDSAQLAITENGDRRPFRPAPAFASAEEAGEMVELY